MTDRLSALLRDQAATIDVPPVPDGVLAAAHRERRHRRTRTTLVTTLVVLLVTVGASAAVSRWLDGDDTIQPADRLAYEQHGAWARGDEVHVGNHTVVVPGTQALQYSAAGVVVSTEKGYVLVTPVGRVRPLDLDLTGDNRFGLPPVGTEPTTANLAYVHRIAAGRAQLVVRDLGTGSETTSGPVFRTHQPDGVDWLSGDLVQTFRDGRGVVYDWRTDARSRTPRTGWWHAAGVSVDYDTDGTWTLRTFDGRRLSTIKSSAPASSYGTLSPDGRYFAFSDAEPRFGVLDVESGRITDFAGKVLPTYGWTPDGHLVGTGSTAGGEVEVCDPATGSCAGTGTTVAGSPTLVAGEPGKAP